MADKCVWERTVSLWQIRRLMPVRSVLRGVAMTSGVRPSDSQSLQTALLTRWVQPAVPAARGAGGVGVGQRLFAEAALENRSEELRTKLRSLNVIFNCNNVKVIKVWRCAHPSFSNSPLQSTTGPPLPMRSRVCKLTTNRKYVDIGQNQ